ncbi:hypothetical protein EDC01DRAFT_754482 [Geopyxis carbonaria]|nr:hypothetical protein EDC01DRAFT_754482 [Geopyxis carbonaria]
MMPRSGVHRNPQLLSDTRPRPPYNALQIQPRSRRYKPQPSSVPSPPPHKTSQNQIFNSLHCTSNMSHDADSSSDGASIFHPPHRTVADLRPGFDDLYRRRQRSSSPPPRERGRYSPPPRSRSRSPPRDRYSLPPRTRGGRSPPPRDFSRSPPRDRPSPPGSRHRYRVDRGHAPLRSAHEIRRTFQPVDMLELMEAVHAEGVAARRGGAYAERSAAGTDARDSSAAEGMSRRGARIARGADQRAAADRGAAKTGSAARAVFGFIHVHDEMQYAGPELARHMFKNVLRVIGHNSAARPPTLTWGGMLCPARRFYTPSYTGHALQYPPPPPTKLNSVSPTSISHLNPRATNNHHHHHHHHQRPIQRLTPIMPSQYTTRPLSTRTVNDLDPPAPKPKKVSVRKRIGATAALVFSQAIVRWRARKARKMGAEQHRMSNIPDTPSADPLPATADPPPSDAAPPPYSTRTPPAPAPSPSPSCPLSSLPQDPSSEPEPGFIFTLCPLHNAIEMLAPPLTSAAEAAFLKAELTTLVRELDPEEYVYDRCFHWCAACGEWGFLRHLKHVQTEREGGVEMAPMRIGEEEGWAPDLPVEKEEKEDEHEERWGPRRRRILEMMGMGWVMALVRPDA